MKKIIMLFPALCVTLMLLCCGCGLLGEQKFKCNVDEVKSIQIVTLDEYIKDEYRYDYTVLAEVTDHIRFANRLMAIETSVNWGEPNVLATGYTVIKIEYLNGDYDMIYYDAQSKKRGEKKNAGFLVFDRKQFNDLISEYVTEEQ
ncbi:MAG: hypothetical protein E7490_07280 [Ruminococcaceae bacterium]|nr:hypothetical protein [Oscillospiraceae bacterium]